LGDWFSQAPCGVFVPILQNALEPRPVVSLDNRAGDIHQHRVGGEPSGELPRTDGEQRYREQYCQFVGKLRPDRFQYELMDIVKPETPEMFLSEFVGGSNACVWNQWLPGLDFAPFLIDCAILLPVSGPESSPPGFKLTV